MTIDVESACQAIRIVLSQPRGKETVITSLRCGAITGLTTIGACVLLGPVGVFVGAAIGSTVAYSTHKNECKSILKVIDEDFSDKDKQELAENVHNFMTKFSIKDAVHLIMILKCHPLCAREFVLVIKGFMNAWQEKNAHTVEPRYNTKGLGN